MKKRIAVAVALMVAIVVILGGYGFYELRSIRQEFDRSIAEDLQYQAKCLRGAVEASKKMPVTREDRIRQYSSADFYVTVVHHYNKDAQRYMTRRPEESHLPKLMLFSEQIPESIQEVIDRNKKARQSLYGNSES